MKNSVNFEKFRLQNLDFEFTFETIREHIVYISILLLAIGVSSSLVSYGQTKIILVYIFLIYISSLLIYYWSDVNRVIIYFILGNKADYFYVSNDVNLSYGEFVKIVKEKNKPDSYYLNILNEHREKFDFINNYIPLLLLKLENNLSDKHKINLFFLASFFSINIVYSIMILSIIYLTKSLNIVSSLDDKAFIIVTITMLFGFTIYVFLKSFSFFHNFIRQTEINKNISLLESIDIYPKIDNLKTISQRISKIKEKIEERESNTFQLAIPVFYLAYISLAISYF